MYDPLSPFLVDDEFFLFEASETPPEGVIIHSTTVVKLINATGSSARVTVAITTTVEVL